MRSLLTTWALSLCALGAQAQAQGVEDRSGEASLACLVRPSQPPKYPADALATRTDGLFRVELNFRDAQSAPEVKVVFGRGPEDLRQAAEQYAQQFRLPCLPAGQRVSALQEIAFRAVDAGEVQTPQPMNLPSPPSAQHQACLVMPQRPPNFGGTSGASTFASGFKPGPTTGNVVLELTFIASDQPPQAKVLYASTHRDHRDDWLAYVATYRVPCLKPGERFVMEQTLHLMFNDNSPRLSFKDVGLVSFLRMVKNAEARPVGFNLDTMACPFRLKFELGRPALRNRVTEVGQPNPNRRSFIAWIEELELALKREQFESLLRASMFIDIPCGTVTLG
jgi:hypothetical protein